MGEYLLRFLIGGIAVSAFAVLGDVFRPKSFAGLFGAAPTIALATLSLAFAAQGGGYAAVEGRSMIIGALALWLYSVTVCQLMQRGRFSALPATVVALLVWFAVALLGGMLLLRGAS
jgi:hypothetical protein